MDRGTTRRSVLVAGMMLLGMILLSCGGVERGSGAWDPTSEGLAPSVFGALHPADTKIIWLLRADDCASCNLPTRDLRRLQRSGRAVPPLIVVVVAGSVDLVRDFLRQERIAATVRHMSAATYRATFGSAPLPRLFVIHRDTVIGMWPGTGWIARGAIAHRIGTGQHTPLLLELELVVGRTFTSNEQ